MKDERILEHGLPTEISDEIHAILDRFEKAWQNGETPSLSQFLRLDGNARLSLLTELIHLDLEYRFRRGDESRVEEYCRQYPELNNSSAHIINLIVAEYRIRKRQEPALSSQSFLDRFSHLRQELAPRLSAIDREENLTAPISGSAFPGGRDRIGPYKLLQKLGEGGMGTVWAAEQTEPVKRRVALKLIKPGMDSAQVLRRFKAEQQALAMMDHSNIAKVLDAGTASNECPYFVMELVKGVPITKYCDELHLSLRERLSLFMPVCQAIQHAHTKGIIHRDIKPSNVLVIVQDGSAVPKVIDFGIAKALHQPLTDQSIFTEIGAVIGTLEYMSPEQAELSPLDLDTRTDVYALGVLLYELLTGSTPFDRRRLQQAGQLGMLKLIREEDPPKPSTRLTASKEILASLATQRRTLPTSLAKEVRGELDWITMKCLEKDRTRRYDTASALAGDIGRFLNDQPVEACPLSTSYRVRKFLRKHRAAVTAAATFMVLLMGGVVVSTWQAIRATRAEAISAAQEKIALRERDDKEEARRIAVNNAENARSATLAERDAKAKLAVALEQVNQERDRAKEAQNRAEEQLDRFRRVYYAAQLQEVNSLWQSNPARAGELLNDLERCPAYLRDFAWGMYSRLVAHSPRLLEGEVSEGPRRLAFSADGKFLAAKEKSGRIRGWDVASGKQILDLVDENDGYLQLLAFSPDGAVLAAKESRFKELRRWEVGSGKPLPSIATEGHTTSLAFSPDGKTLAWTSGVRISLFGIESEAQRQLTATKTSLTIQSLAFSSDGKKLVTGHGKALTPDALHDPGEIVVWDLEGGKELTVWKAHLGFVSSVAFSADAKTISSASRDGDVKLWDAKNGKEIAVISRWNNTLIEQTTLNQSGTIAALPGRGYVQLVDIAARKEWKTSFGRENLIAAVAISADGHCWAAQIGDRLGIWENVVMETATLKGHVGQVYSINFSPDSKLLATCSGDSQKLWQLGQVKIWDVAARREKFTLDEQVAGFYAVKFSPDGLTVASGSALGEVKLWDAATGEPRNSWRGHLGVIRCLAYAPDGRILATAGTDQTIKFWNASDGQLLKTLTGHRGWVTRLAFSRSGSLLVSAGADADKKAVPGEVKLWDVASGNEIADFKGHKDRVFDVAFSPDEKTAASVAFDQNAILWDVPTRQLRAILGGNSKFGKGVAFSSDGRTLVVGGSELDALGKRVATVKFWDPLIGQPRSSFPAHEGFMNALAFDPQDRILATAGSDGTIKLWEATSARVHGGAD